MILHQFYLNCLAHASYLVGDEVDRHRRRRRSAARHRSVPRVRRGARPADRARASSRTSTPTSSPGTSSCAIAPARRSTWARRRRPSTRSRRSRRRRDRARPRAAAGARNAGPHAGVDLDPRLRPRPRAPTRRTRVLTGDTLFVGDVGRPDLRVALGWSAADLGGLLYDSLHDEAADAARREPGLPGARRRLAVRQGAQQGDGLDDRRAAALELRAAADDEGGVRRAGHGRPARRAAVLHLRRGAEQPRSGRRSTRRSTRELKPLTLDAGARAAATAARRCSTRATRASSPRRTCAAASTSAWAASTRRGPARCSTASGRSCIIADPGRETRGGAAPRPHRLRPRRRLSGGRAAQPGRRGPT